MKQYYIHSTVTTHLLLQFRLVIHNTKSKSAFKASF